MAEAPAVSQNSEMPIASGVSPLTMDLPCARCSYNLRGLTADMNCPECGTPVSRSNLGNWLRFADPVWVGKLRQGMSLKLWNILFGLLVGIVVAITGALFGSPQIAGMLMALLGGLLGAWTVFLITTPEPTVGAVEDLVTVRKVIRIAVVSGIVLNTVQQSGFVRGELALALVIGILSGCTGLVVNFGELLYLRRFARRIPDEPLARSTGTVLYGQIVCTAVLMLAGALGGAALLSSGAVTATKGGIAVTTTPKGLAVAPAAAPSLGPLFAIAGILGGLAGVGMLVFGIWYLRLVLRYRRAFRAAETEATALAVPEARPVAPLNI